MKVSVKINPTAQILKKRGLNQGGRVQRYIDSEVLRLSDPYVPMLTGALKHSGTTGTVIGSGLVVYNATYARRNYYSNAGHGRQGTQRGGKRGKYWFERMKADHGKEIISGAKKAIGGR